VRYLIYVHEQVPNLFRDSIAYDFDLLKLLTEEARLLKALAQMPEYGTLLQTKPLLLEIIVRPKAETRLKTLRVKPEAVAGWKADLNAAIERLPRLAGVNSEQTLVHAIGAELTTLGGKGSEQLLTGLIATLPNEL